MILDAATSLGGGADSGMLCEPPPPGWGRSLGGEFAPAKWTYVAAAQVPRRPGDVLVEAWVREALIALNPEIAASRIMRSTVLDSLKLMGLHFVV
jgi:hypothetical protein